MKKFLKFSLCMLLALSLPTGNVAVIVNAIGINAKETVADNETVNSSTEGAVENEQNSILPTETVETQEPEVTQKAEETEEPKATEKVEETPEPEATEETKETKQVEVAKDAKNPEVQENTEKSKSENLSKETVTTKSSVKKSAMQAKAFSINFTIDLDIADEAGTVQTVDGKKVEGTEQTVTADIKDLKVTKADGKNVYMFEDKYFANDGLREFYSVGLPFSDKKEMTVRFQYVVTVNGTKYEIPFEKTYKGSDEECKAFGYMKINVTKAELLEAVTHTVTFVDYDGKVLSVNEDVLIGTSAVAPENPERTGYTFTGWSCAYDKITSDLTVKAQYKVNEYNVTFVDYDGTQIGQVQKVQYEKAAVAPAEPSREGYTFTGWDKEFDKITGDLTITAEYELNKYKVTFVDYDETVIGEVLEVEHGKAAKAPEAPSRAGYTFIGWDVDFNEVRSDLTITAQYEMLPSVLTGTAMFFVINSDERPEEPASHSSKNYTRVGDGIIKLEAVHNDDEKVNANIIEAPSIEAGWTVEWYVIKKESDGWHVDGIKVKTSSGSAIDEVEPLPTESANEPTETPTGSAIEPIETSSGSAIEPTETSSGSAIEPMETSSGSAIEPMETPSGSAIEPMETPTGGAIGSTETPTATPTNGNASPYIPYIGPIIIPTVPEIPAGPVAQQTPEAPTIEPSEKATITPLEKATATPTVNTGTGAEDTDEKNTTAGPSATPTIIVEIEEDEIPAGASVASAVPTLPNVEPTKQAEVTATTSAEESITVQDSELPDSSSASDEETDDSTKATEKEKAVKLEEEDIANSSTETDEEDAGEEIASDDKASEDIEEIEEDEIANALPQTGVKSGNVFYFVGSMICALGICILTVIRRKATK